MKIIIIILITIGAISCTSVEPALVCIEKEQIMVPDIELIEAMDSADMYRYGN